MGVTKTFLRNKNLKARIKGALTDFSVAMVTSYVTKMTTSLFNTSALLWLQYCYVAWLRVVLLNRHNSKAGKCYKLLTANLTLITAV